MLYTLMFGSYTFPNQTFEVVNLPINNGISEDNIPRKQGALIQTPYLKARKIKIKGAIYNATRESAWTELMDLQSNLLSGEGKFYHRSDRYIDCYTKKINPKFAKGTDKGVIDLEIELVAQNPYFIAAGASTSDAFNVTGDYNFNINGLGKAFEEPKIYICATGGEITDEIKFTLGSKSFSFRGTVANGKTVEIDTKEVTVENNSADGLSQFEGDFLTVEAGSNAFQYEGFTGRLTIEHRPRWY